MCGRYCHPGRSCGNTCRNSKPADDKIVVDEVEEKNDGWIKIGLTRLFEQDKNLLTGGDWLTDNIIFAAQQLLHQQNPQISGLQDPALAMTRTFAVQGSQEFVQCLNMSDNHWITISTVGCEPSTIKVYDSANGMLTSTMKTVMADLLHTNNKNILI